jgi:hypothetical protein
MILLPEVREEIVAAATRRAAANPGSRGRVSGWFGGVGFGGFVVALGVGCAIAVAVVALVALKHRPPSRPASSAGSSIAALEAKLAVLRRPQTPADRTYPAPVHTRPGARTPFGVIPKLTRLAANVSTPTTGPLRVYLIVRPIPKGPTSAGSAAAGTYGVNAGVVSAHGEIQGGSQLVTATTLATPNVVGSGLSVPGEGTDPNRGVSVAVVPDGVTRVQWVFTGAGIGILHPHPVTTYPQVRNNVAVAAVTPQEGPLARATWYGADGRVIASAGGGAQADQQLQTIRSINASRSRAISPFLIAHYGLFRTVPPDDPTRDWRLPTPGTEGGYVGAMGVNYWQTRYIASVRGLDGPGLWITPGARGLCISDAQAGDCGMLTSRAADGIIGGSTAGGGRETITGLVPDGNRTVTIVLADGTRKTSPVIDNVYEATVRGRIVAIINKNTAGRIEQHAL